MAHPTSSRRATSLIHLAAPTLLLVSAATSCTSKSNVGGSSEAGTPGGSGATTASGGTSGNGGTTTSGGTTASGGGSPIDSSGGANSGGNASTRDAAPDANGEAADGGRHFSTDPKTFLGASRCAAAHVQLCDDFESDTLDTSIWQAQGQTITIDGTHKARGSRALHILKQNDGYAFIREKKTFPEAGDTYWGRLFVYFESLPTTPMTYAHWTMLAASGTGVSGEIRVSGQLSSGNNLWGVGTDNRTDPNGTGDWTTSDDDPKGKAKPVPLHEWHCVEWMHAGGNTNETRFFLDGVEHPSLHTTATKNGGNGKPYILPEFTNVWVGWQEYQTSTETFELWMDSVAIDATRIGCDI